MSGEDSSAQSTGAVVDEDPITVDALFGELSSSDDDDNTDEQPPSKRARDDATTSDERCVCPFVPTVYLCAVRRSQ